LKVGVRINAPIDLLEGSKLSRASLIFSDEH